MKVVYKRFSRINGVLMSCFVQGVTWQGHNLCLRYRPGIKTVPEIGKIFAFDTLEHAPKYAHNNREHMTDRELYVNFREYYRKKIIPELNVGVEREN